MKYADRLTPDNRVLCTRCLAPKPPGDFYAARQTGRPYSRCKACQAAYYRAYNRRPGRSAERDRRAENARARAERRRRRVRRERQRARRRTPIGKLRAARYQAAYRMRRAEGPGLAARIARLVKEYDAEIARLSARTA